MYIIVNAIKFCLQAQIEINNMINVHESIIDQGFIQSQLHNY